VEQLKKLGYFCHLFIILVAMGAYAATPALRNDLFSGSFGVRSDTMDSKMTFHQTKSA
jgi:hypothetical protein